MRRKHKGKRFDRFDDDDFVRRYEDLYDDDGDGDDELDDDDFEDEDDEFDDEEDERFWAWSDPSRRRNGDPRDLED